MKKTRKLLWAIIIVAIVFFYFKENPEKYEAFKDFIGEKTEEIGGYLGDKAEEIGGVVGEKLEEAKQKASQAEYDTGTQEAPDSTNTGADSGEEKLKPQTLDKTEPETKAEQDNSTLVINEYLTKLCSNYESRCYIRNEDQTWYFENGEKADRVLQLDIDSTGRGIAVCDFEGCAGPNYASLLVTDDYGKNWLKTADIIFENSTVVCVDDHIIDFYTNGDGYYAAASLMTRDGEYIDDFLFEKIADVDESNTGYFVSADIIEIREHSVVIAWRVCDTKYNYYIERMASITPIGTNSEERDRIAYIAEYDKNLNEIECIYSDKKALSDAARYYNELKKELKR